MNFFYFGYLFSVLKCPSVLIVHLFACFKYPSYMVERFYNTCLEVVTIPTSVSPPCGLPNAFSPEAEIFRVLRMSSEFGLSHGRFAH